MKKSLSAIFFIFILFLSGCGPKPPYVSTPMAFGTAEATLPPAGTAGASKRPTPAQLGTMRTNAAAVIDDISQKNWAAAKDKVAMISSDMKTLRPLLDSAGIPKATADGMTSAVTGLGDAVASNKQYDAMAQANMITGFIPDIADYFETSIPTDMLRLSYQVRALMLDIRHQDWPGAEDVLETAGGIWYRVKSTLGPSSKQDCNRFQGCLDKLKPEIDKKDVSGASADVKTLLDTAAVLEKDFSEKNKKP